MAGLVAKFYTSMFGQREFHMLETAHLLLGKPLVLESFVYSTLRTDGQRTMKQRVDPDEADVLHKDNMEVYRQRRLLDWSAVYDFVRRSAEQGVVNSTLWHAWA